jgi:tetratricopeptide (TPR) repeat protein
LAGKSKVYDEAMAMAANFRWDQNWSDAVKAYRAALEEFPNDSQALAGLGAAYLELEQTESAIRALQRALKADPANQEAMNTMGLALEISGRTSDAVKTYLYSGNMYAKTGQMEDAISIWEKAAQLDPGQVQARNNLAQAYARTGRYGQAVAELISVAAIYQQRDDPQKAHQFLQGALKLRPDDEYAQVALRALQNGDSIRVLEEEMRHGPDLPLDTPDADSHDEDPFDFDIDEDDEVAGNPREKATQMAMEELASILFEDEEAYAGQLSISKMELDAYIGQAIDWQTRGESSQAIEVYEHVINTGFNNAATHFALANLYLEGADYDQAIHYFNQAKQNKQYLSGANFSLGECYNAQGDVNQALRYYVEVLKAIDLENSNRASTKELESLYAALIDNYLSQGNDQATRRFVKTLVNFLSSKDWESKIVRARRRLGIDDDSSVSAWIEFLEAGQAEAILSAMADTAEYMRQNMLMTAAEECYWAIQRAPNYLPLHMRLAEVFLKQDRIEDSIRKYLAVAEVYRVRNNTNQVSAIYQRILKIAPMDITVRTKLIELNVAMSNYDAALEHYKTLADAYYQLAQVDRSLEIYQEALRLAPRSSGPRQWQISILYSIGDIYNQRVDWRNASQIYERVVQISPEDDKALLQLVDLYFKLGRHDEAIKMLDRLLALYNKQGKQTKMLQALQDMVELRPDEFILRKKLASFYVEFGMMQEALDQFSALSEMQLEAGLPDDAANTIEAIINLKPQNVENYRELLNKIRGGIY